MNSGKESINIILENKANSDSYITAKPQITFFKKIINRHTNFTRQWNVNSFDTNLNWGEMATCTFNKFGDLLGKNYLVVKLNTRPIVLTEANSLEYYKDEINILQTDVVELDSLKVILRYFINMSLEDWSNIDTKYATIIKQLNIKEVLDKLKNSDEYVSNNIAEYNNEDVETNDIMTGAFSSNPEIELNSAMIDDIIDTLVNLDAFNEDDRNREYFKFYKITKFHSYIELVKEIDRLALVRIDSTRYIIQSQLKIKLRALYKQKKEHPIHKILENVIKIKYKDKLYSHLIKELKFYIGDYLIASQNIHQLRSEYNINRQSADVVLDQLSTIDPDVTLSNSQQIMIPLMFWFSAVTTNYFPLVALRYQTIRLELEINDFENVIENTDREIAIIKQYDNRNYMDIIDSYLHSEYIFLSRKERQQFSIKKLNYLVSGSDFALEQMTDIQYEMSYTFGHPIRRLFFSVYRSSDDTYIPLESCKLLFTTEHGTDITDPFYYSTVQTWQHSRALNSRFYYLSFELFDNPSQPSGSCNLGIIPHKQLQIVLDKQYLPDVKDLTLIMSSVYHNILSIENGMAKLEF